MKGEVIYLYAYDLAYEADLAGIEASMRGTAERFRLGRLRDTPRDFPVYHPLLMQFEEMQLAGPRGPIVLSVLIKIFSVGAVSVKVRMPFNCERLTELVGLRELHLSDGTTLDGRIGEIVQRLFENLKPHLDTPVAVLAQPEVYTVYCLNPPLDGAAADGDSISGQSSADWLRRNEREVAALLDDETDPSCLSEQEIQETLKYAFSYYKHDLAVVEWDAALVVDTPEGYQDTLYVLEVANLQLEELRVYDAKLDAVLDKAYDDVEATTRLHAFRSRQHVLNELREIRMDLTEVADQLSNISKFFGDWHLARIYIGCAARFHLAEWEGIVGQKLRALDGLYSMLQQDSVNRVMMMLEVAIVGLFVIDLVIIVALGIK